MKIEQMKELRRRILEEEERERKADKIARMVMLVLSPAIALFFYYVFRLMLGI